MRTVLFRRSACVLLLCLIVRGGIVGQTTGSLRMHFIEAAGGDAVLLISPMGEVAMFDSGPRSTCGATIAYLQSLGLTTLDYYITTQNSPERDGCAADVLQMFPLRKFALDRGEVSGTAEFQRYLKVAGSKRRTPSVGDTLALDTSSDAPVAITFLAKNGNGLPSKSERSLGLYARITFGEFSATVGSDIAGESTAGEVDLESVLAPVVGHVDVYKVHGHGAATSSTAQWLAATTPTVGVISVDPGNNEALPSESALERLHQVGTHTFWTSIGNGAMPATPLDTISGTTVVEMSPHASQFSVLWRGGSQRFDLRRATRAAALLGNAAPFGTIDTPADGATVAGELPVTGWALDDSGIAGVRVYREPIATEARGANGLVFIGDATLVAGARPDVAGKFPTFPGKEKAGWGIMVLSNMLPNQGNGVYRLYAYARSTSGEEQLLGIRTVVSANAASKAPFGTIDTPGQGATVSGVITNFGWALTPQPNNIAIDGTTIGVYVDGTLVGHPTYNKFRSDIAGLFPGLANSGGAVGLYVLDTTKLANGVHTIAWGVVDSAGNASGIGSRFFTVDNSAPAPPGLVLNGSSETAFAPSGGSVRLDVVGTTVTGADDVYGFLNGEPVPRSAIETTATSIVLNGLLREGRNRFIIAATDVNGEPLYKEFTLWAGSNTIQGTVVDTGGSDTTGAAITLQLYDDKRVGASAASQAGAFTFVNVPGRTVFITANASGNRLGSAGVRGDVGSVTIPLRGFGAASPIDNNDFSQGTAGWETGTAPVSIVPHQSALLSDSVFRNSAAVSADNDLRLDTAGEGPQTITRTFDTPKGTKSVTVKYQFVTSEVPGGYFGTEFNDEYFISVRSAKAGGVHSEHQSMNALGLGAFDANGATGWREAALAVDPDGDTVEVTVSVSNVGDGIFDSHMLVDAVYKKKLAIVQSTLNDTDNGPLEMFSADTAIPGTYMGGASVVNGTITIEGDKDATLQSLTLEIIQGGQIAAIADLVPAAGSSLLQRFGDTEKVSISSSQPLFRLPATKAGGLNLSANGTISLQIHAKTDTGEDVTEPVADGSSYSLLVRYTGNNRFGPTRDEQRGGDDWALPSVRDLIAAYSAKYSDLIWNDFSNMHGGSFKPDHVSHDQGIDVDGLFIGYLAARNAAAATRMLNLLNDPLGSNIEMVFVAFKRVPTDSFWTTIQNAVLADGRKAADVIVPDKNHANHFHWRFKE